MPPGVLARSSEIGFIKTGDNFIRQGHNQIYPPYICLAADARNWFSMLISAVSG
jgi:hypothetical protein